MQVVPNRLLIHDDVTAHTTVNGSSGILIKDLSKLPTNQETYSSRVLITLPLEGKQKVTTGISSVTITVSECGIIPQGLFNVTDLSSDRETFKGILVFIDRKHLEALVGATITTDTVEAKIGPQTINRSQSLRDWSNNVLTDFDNRKEESEILEELSDLVSIIEREHPGLLKTYLATSKLHDIYSIHDVMEEHSLKPLMISDYAYLTGKSTSTFRREFHEHFGASPQSWLMDVRLSTSKKLLKDSVDTPITHVAYRSGFSDLSFFNRVFKREVGVTPSMFRAETA